MPAKPNNKHGEQWTVLTSEQFKRLLGYANRKCGGEMSEAVIDAFLESEKGTGDGGESGMIERDVGEA